MATAQTQRQIHDLGDKPLRRGRLDIVGVILSALCLVHCLFAPILFVALPTTEIWFFTDEFHLHMALILVLTAALTFVPGFIRHRHPWVACLAIVGLCAVSGAAFFPSSWTGAEALVTILGSLTLILAHWQNRRLLRPCAAGAHN